MKAQQIFETLNPNLFRQVVERPAYFMTPDGTMSTIPGKKVLAYADNEEFVSVVGKKYRIVNNEEVYLPLCQALEESKLDTEGLETKTGFGICGRALTSIIFPAHSVDIGKHNDKTHLRLVVRNSFDGSWKFQVDMGGFRVACANGQIAGKFANVYKNMHTTNFATKVMVNQLDCVLENFDTAIEQWVEYANTQLPFNNGVDLILEYMGRKDVDDEKKQKMLTSGRAHAFSELVEKYKKYISELGESKYALYNTLTDHATHESDKPEIQQYRQMKIAEILQ